MQDRPFTVFPALKKRNPSRTMALGFGTAVVVVLVVLGLGLTIFDLAYSDRIYPGVRVLNVDVGGLTKDKAIEVLGDHLKNYSASPVTLTFEGREWRPSPDQIGVQVDVESTVSDAIAVGRQGGFTESLGEKTKAWQSGASIPLSVRMDPKKVQEYLAGVANEIDRPTVEGAVWLESLEVRTRTAQPGQKLDVPAAEEAVRLSLSTLSAEKIPLRVEPLNPVIADEEVARAKTVLSNTVGGPFTLTYADRKWTLERNDIASLVEVNANESGKGQKHITIDFNRDKLHELAGRIAKEINRNPRDARFQWNGGSLSPIWESQDGWTVDEEATVEALTKQLPTEARDLTLPVKVTNPAVSSQDVASLGIKELIGEGKSSFVGSIESRATNIKVAAGYLHGAVIPPGEVFSFNDTIGPITKEAGYVEGLTIAADATVPDVGGGVCQVSTTTWRASFWSGLPTVERNNHLYRVGWYEQMGEPVGFDAAIYQPYADLKFKNNTSAYILIQTSVEDSILVVSFYGTKPGWEVELGGPVIGKRTPPPADVYETDPKLEKGTKKQVEWAKEGLEVTITRKVSKDGEVIRTDEFPSVFKAWPNKFLVNP